MTYQANNYQINGFTGLSEAILTNHFTLYQGYVTNTNKLSDLLKSYEVDGKQTMPEYAEIKRRFGWEWNGMRLHELYFENITSETMTMPDKIKDLVVNEFGSVELWAESFKSSGLMRGIGWVILYYDEVEQKLFNQWINEHDVSHLAGLKPVLVMDVFEHAFMLDYGLKRADYVNFFMSHIDWNVVASRL